MPSEVVIKTFGSLLLLGCAVWYGNTVVAEERRRTEFWSELCRFLRYIGDKIALFSMPLPELLSSFSGIGKEWQKFAVCYRTYGLKRAVDEYAGEFGKEGKDLLQELADRIGEGYLDDTVKLCRYTETKMCGLLEERIRKQKESEKLYRTVPVFIALSAILMLI